MPITITIIHIIISRSRYHHTTVHTELLITQNTHQQFVIVILFLSLFLFIQLHHHHHSSSFHFWDFSNRLRAGMINIFRVNFAFQLAVWMIFYRAFPHSFLQLMRLHLFRFPFGRELIFTLPFIWEILRFLEKFLIWAEAWQSIHDNGCGNLKWYF